MCEELKIRALYWVDECPAQFQAHPKPVNAALFGNGVFDYVIEFKWGAKVVWALIQCVVSL